MVSSESDSIYQDITSPVGFEVSNESGAKDYTLNVELLSVQRDYNFNSATLMAENHATKERRKACGYVANGSDEMYVKEDFIAFDSKWHTLNLIFIKNDYSDSGYSLDVWLDNEFMLKQKLRQMTAQRPIHMNTTKKPTPEFRAEILTLKTPITPMSLKSPKHLNLTGFWIWALKTAVLVGKQILLIL